jgi:hypothetical protein
MPHKKKAASEGKMDSPLNCHCQICHDEIPVNPSICEPCQHTFCHDCITRWMQQQQGRLCPIDRQVVKEINPNNLMKKTLENLIELQETGGQLFFRPEEISTYKRRLEEIESSSTTMSTTTDQIHVRGSSMENAIPIDWPSTSSSATLQGSQRNPIVID